MRSIAWSALLLSGILVPLSVEAQDFDEGKWGWRNMMWDGNWGWGHMAVGGLMMVLFWALVIALAVLLVRALSSERRSPPAERPALAILEERFARGEIDRAEFEERRRLIL